ncbi:putative kinase [Rhizobium sp. WW_1]|jgi:predicted kinase|nr:putative kinase [Rhizobium sp. WW_1]
MSDHQVNMPRATLYMLCGKIAPGKSTLTAELSHMPSTRVLSEDWWMSRLFGAELNDVSDYIRYSRRLRDAIGPVVSDLLRIGVSVVLGFPANTPAIRSWMRALFEAASADHRLYFLDVPDELCKARLRATLAEPTIFQPPTRSSTKSRGISCRRRTKKASTSFDLPQRRSTNRACATEKGYDGGPYVRSCRRRHAREPGLGQC